MTFSAKIFAATLALTVLSSGVAQAACACCKDMKDGKACCEEMTKDGAPAGEHEHQH